MNRVKYLIICLTVVSVLLFHSQITFAQTCFNNYTLSPTGNVCGASANMTLSGSQSGVTYQLMVNGSNYGSPVNGTGSSINLGTVTSAASSGGGTFLVRASKSGGTCSPTIIAGGSVYFVPLPDGTVSASNTEICSGGPVTFTVNPAASGTYSYQWYQGGVSISGATAQSYSVTTNGTYSVRISNSCGAKTLACPTLTTVQPVGLLGPITGPITRVAGSVGTATYSVSPAPNATIYFWAVIPATAGAFSGSGTSATFTWSADFYGTAIISAVGSNGCGAPSNTSSINVSVDLPAAAAYSYLKETDIRVPNITSVTAIPALPIGQKSVTFTYSDQAGRPIQTVAQAGSPSLSDAIQTIAYDPAGRQLSSYLPFTNAGINNGSYKATPIANQATYYNPGTPGAPNIATSSVSSSQTNYDNSPLNRVIEKGNAGSTWVLGGGHAVKYNYGTNSYGEIYKWTVSTSPVGASYSYYYDPGTLKITTVTDENGNSVAEYKDFQGRLICKKVQSGPTAYLYTYYIYDDSGNLRYVIPPLPTVPIAVSLPSYFVETDPLFLNFIYGYHYDGRNRLIEKKIPGKGWEYYVYNKLDQVILTQNPTQLNLGVWVFSKYDSKGRLVLTGDYTTTATRPTLQSNADAFSSTLMSENFTNAATNYGYSDVSYPDNTVSSSKTILSVNFYDNYTFLTNSSINPNSAVFTQPPAIDTILNMPFGLTTGNISKVLGAATTTYLLTANYFDTHSQMVKSVGQYFKSSAASSGNYNIVQNQYSFSKLLIKTVKAHYVSSSVQLTINTFYTYDAHGRKILLQQQYNSGPLTSLAKYDYNELGQLITKNLHNVGASGIPASSAFLQHLNFKYNIRGWLNFINNPISGTLADPQFSGQTDVFAEEIDYEQPVTSYAGTSAQFNGNISTVSWQTLIKPGLGMTQELKGYVFNYDPLNRLTASLFKAPSGNDKYNEAMSYDELGNILSLDRHATSTTYLNKLSYNYGTGSQRSNQLLTIQDNGGTENYTSTFSYTTNTGSETGNTKTGVTQIAYNELGLPSLITFSAGKTISFAYSSSGEKLERIIKQGTTIAEDRSYVSGIEYTTNGIDYIHTEEGRARFNGTNYIQEYTVTDHLGNARVIFGDEDGSGTFSASDIVQETDYYGFGRQIAGLEANPLFQYKFNGKEYSTDLNEYDYGARYYNPVTARWNGVDNAAESNRRWSPYTYTKNNPIRYIDVDGNWDGTGYVWAYYSVVQRPADIAINTARQEASVDAAYMEYLAGHSDYLPDKYDPLSIALRNTVISQINDQYSGYLKSTGNSSDGDLFHALNSGASGEGFNYKGFGNFVAHLTPFGGVIDFTKSAKENNVGGAALGLASSSAFFLGDATISNTESFVYRSDFKETTAAFENGFTAKGLNRSLVSHAYGAPDSYYIPTSFSKAEAATFRPPGAYLYTIKKPVNGIDLNSKFGLDYIFYNESEYAVPSSIPGSFIHGAQQLLPGGQLGPYIYNPYYPW